jgi:hypothetical protein
MKSFLKVNSMQSEKATEYINRLSNLQDKCYTHIVSIKAVEIAMNYISEKLSAMLETDDIDKLKSDIKELINK